MRQLSLSAKHTMIAVCCLAFTGALWVLLPAVSTQTGGWPQDVSDVAPTDYFTGTDGSMSVMRGCTSAGPAFNAKTFNADGMLRSAVAAPQEDLILQFCNENKAFDKNSVLYGVLYDSSASKQRIVAYDGGTELWSRQITDPTACDGELVTHLQPEHMAIGADGYLYVVSEEDDDCGGTRHYLSKLRASDGEVIFNKDLGNSGAEWFGAYDKGVVMYGGQRELRYFDFSGNETATLAVEPQASGALPEAATLDGSVYFNVYQESQRNEACDDHRKTIGIAGYAPSGKVFHHELPFCENVESMAVTHQHTVAFVTTSVNVPSATFIKLTNDGEVVQRTLLPDVEGVYHYSSFFSGTDDEVVADTNGNILLSRGFRRDDDRRTGAEFTLSAGNSDVTLARFSTDSLKSDGNFRTSVHKTGLTPGRLFIHDEISDYLYAVDIAELGMDYPRGALLGAEPVEAPQSLNYIALGDSFASGEGDGIYLPGTDGELHPDEKCHISNRSYPYLIAQQLDMISHGLDREFASVACSGAVMDDVINDSVEYVGSFDQYRGIDDNGLVNIKEEALNGFTPGRAAQIQFVQKYKPAALTIGIGGNDANFGKKLAACVSVNPLQTCEYASSELPKEGKDLQALFGELKAVYEDLKTVSEGKTKIYVIGYPRFINSDVEICRALNVGLNKTEREYANQSLAYLNDVVEAAAKAAGVYYVDIEDALAGKELCSTPQPFIYANGLNLGEEQPFLFDSLKIIGNESYHPNHFGHGAMALAFAERIGNPLTHQPCPLIIVTYPYCPDDTVVAPDIPDYFGTAGPTYVQKKVQDMTGAAVRGAGQALDVTVQGFKSATLVSLWLESNPVELGTYTADENGRLSVSTDLPASIKPGYHTIHAQGTGVSGEPVHYYQFVLVTGPDNDLDGDGILNDNDSCLFVQPADVDQDGDGIDDACDKYVDNIYELPLPETPTVELADPINIVNQANVAVSGTGKEGATAIVLVDDENEVTDPISTEVELTSSTYLKKLDVSSLDDGTITATVSLKNEYGTGAPATDKTTKDTKRPRTTMSLNPVPNSAGWNKGEVIVTLESRDEGTDIQQFAYKATGAQAIPETIIQSTEDIAAVSIPISAEGETTVTYFATDNAGNAEREQIKTVRIDNTPPTTSLDQPDYSLIISAFGGKLTGTANDEHSGVATTKVTLQDVPSGKRHDFSAPCISECDSSETAWSVRPDSIPTGIYHVSVSSIDKAGNGNIGVPSKRIIILNINMWFW